MTVRLSRRPKKAKRFYGHNLTLDERFLARRSEPTPSGCREWAGATNEHGYGVLRRKDGSNLVHVYAWERVHGPVPEGLELRHTCDNPPCCEESHLILGTRSDNMMDAVERGRHHNASKTECKNGHELTEENVYLEWDAKRGKHYRKCRTCRTEKSRTWARKSRVGRRG